MRTRRSASRRLFAVAVALGALGGCRLFVDLDGITGDAPARSDGSPSVDGPGSLGDSGGEENSPPSDAADGARSPLLEGIVMLLHMDEKQWNGAFSVTDSSGRANHGTPVNTVVPAAGKFGNAAKLDGAGWISVRDSASLRATDHLTVSAWINLSDKTDASAAPGIISKRDGYQMNVAYSMFLFTNETLWIDIGDNSRSTSSTSIVPNVWAHVAVVFDGTLAPSKRITTYVNGIPDGTFAFPETTIPAATSDLLIGNLINGGDTFVGLIDEAAVWSRSLGAAEILTIATSNEPL